MARALAAMPAAEFHAHLERATEADRRVLLRGRFKYDLEGFCRYCWPERFTLPFNRLHAYLFGLQDLPAWYDRTADVLDAVAAPRGFAKSTLVSFAAIVHAIVYDSEAYIVLLSATQRLSLSLSRDLRAQFRKSAGRQRARKGRAGRRAPSKVLEGLYGPFEVQGNAGEWEVSVRGRASVGLLARSFGTEVRGAKHPERGIRPTLVVIDDGEKKDRVRNPDQRQVWWESLTKDVLKLAPRQGGTAFRVVGTVLHPDAMLARLLADPGWRKRRWQAIEKWPDRKDLWEACRRVWADLSWGDRRVEMARRFYEARREEMDRGAVLLDPASKGLFELHEILWGQGLASFLSELQNEPVDPTTQIFASDRFASFRVIVEDGEQVILRHDGRKIRLRDLRLRGFWDPSTGSPGDDFAAIAILGRDQHGYTYVLDVWMRRAKPSEQLAAAWTLAERWGCSTIGVESNGFQKLITEPYARERADRREKGEYWKLVLLAQGSHDNKELRLATMEPDCTNGWMLFNESVPREVLGQFDEFPSAAHDDGPDAVHGAWSKLGGRPVQMETRPARAA